MYLFFKTVHKLSFTLMLLIALAISNNSYAQVTVTGSNGVNGTYTSLTKAAGFFAAINAGPSQAGFNITVTITANITTEDGANSLTNKSWNSMLIQPSGARTISGTVVGTTNSMINFNGADNVNIDGLNSGGNSLVITNLSTSGTAGTSTIRFIADASNNTIQNCTIKGSETSTSSGLIFFSTGTTTGNDNNRILNCQFTRDAAGRPISAIYSAGTVAMTNSNNEVSGCAFYDLINGSNASNVISVFSNSDTWTISNNHFYETTSFAPANNVEYRMINIVTGGGHTISGNYIGGSTVGCGGTAFTKTNAFYNTFVGINLTVATTPVTNVQGNVITNFNYSNSVTVATNFSAIKVTSGLINIGDVSGNIIGNPVTNDAITFTNGATGGGFYGIDVNSASDVMIMNNSITGVTTNNSNAANATVFYGINLNGTGIKTVGSNTIGSTLANSIKAQSTSTSGSQVMYGIFNAGNAISAINSCTIQNFTNSSTNTTAATAVVCGIANTVSASNINENLICKLSCASGQTAATHQSSICGIAQTSTTVGQTIALNTIYDLTNTYSGANAVTVHGIYFNGPTSGSNIIERNFIYNLNANSSAIASEINGIRIAEANTNITNNIISLGYSVSVGYLISGIKIAVTNAARTNNLYFNTVCIGGTTSGTMSSCYALNESVSHIRNIRNNIFYNTRDGGATGFSYAINLSNNTSLTENYNDYFVSGTRAMLGRINAANQTSLASWQTATTQDANSVNANPNFTSPGGTSAVNYTPAQAGIVGITGTGVTYDYFYSVRGNGLQTIGAIKSSVSLTGSKLDAFISSAYSGSFTTLKAAFDDVNAGNITGSIQLRVIGTTTESVTAVLNASGSGSANYSDLTIYPTMFGLSISGAIAAPLIDLNGADNVVIDGRVNMSGSTPDLIITNASTSNTVGTSTIRFINDASTNTLQYCVIKGAETINSSGILFFSTSTGSTGNDNNFISYCNITADDAGRPINAVASFGSAGLLNSGNYIGNCNFYDVLNKGAASYVILVSSNSENWSVSDNHFYETVSFIPTANTGLVVIGLNGDGHLVSGNYIGGQAQYCGGAAWTKTSAFDNSFIGIRIIGGTVTPGSIQGNYIQNFNYSNSSTGSFTGIEVQTGSFNIGTITSNVIGDPTGTGSIVFNAAVASTTFKAINALSINSTSIQNTMIGSLTLSANVAFNGIYLNGNAAGNYYISNNSIGNSNANNISVASNLTNAAIYAEYSVEPLVWSIDNNLIQNINSTSTGNTCKLYGIYYENNVNCSTSVTINNNSINTLTTVSTYTSTSIPAICGIWVGDAGAAFYFENHSIYKNTISGIYANSTGSVNVSACGIYIPFATGTTGMLNGFDLSYNRIENVENKCIGGSGNIYGVYYRPTTGSGRTSTYFNNVIVLTNGANSNAIYITGFNLIANSLPSSLDKIYHNTVKIGGTASGSTASYSARISPGAGTTEITNNVFQNVRSGGTLTKYAYYNDGTDGTVSYNYIEVTGGGNVAFWGGSARSFAGWQGLHGTTELTGTVTIDNMGRVITASNANVKKTGANLYSYVTEDIESNSRANGAATIPGGPYDGPWRGAYETAGPTVITISSVSSASFCKGAPITILFEVSGDELNTGNTFTAQLSDASGSFSSPTAIGNLSSTTGGSINGTINVTTAGSAYRVRIDADNPTMSSADNGYNITIYTPQIYWVTNISNSGAGSLNAAIGSANANCGHDTIKFAIAGAGPHTIGITTALPSLTDNKGVTINGFSQSGASANTVEVFNTTTGTPINAVYKIILGNSGTLNTALNIASKNNVIKGLVIQDYGDGTPSANDISINITSDSNSVLGCIIGLDYLGVTKGTKSYNGIKITGAYNNIGDGTAAGANIISGMNGTGMGIYINNATAISNTVKGNMIGMQKDGTTAVSGASQSYGVYVATDASNNYIGGSAIGEGNVISGNNYYGIYFSNTDAGGSNYVYGNIVGPQANGNTIVTGLPQARGIYTTASTDVYIGGAGTYERNYISANSFAGIMIEGVSANSYIKGNYIGTNKNGTGIITGGSQDYGVYLNTVTTGGNIIVGGDATIGEGNVVSGNDSYGFYLTSTSTNVNIVRGNIIGPQANGNSYLTSNAQSYGIYILNSNGNFIGGTTVGYRNIISANQSYGININGASSYSNIVRGNYIGIAANGTSLISGAGQQYGVYLSSTAFNNVIGSTAGHGNVISGNAQAGIYSASTSANYYYGNIIGLQSDGLSYVATNIQQYGISFVNATSQVVGGGSAGEGNVISGNETAGINFGPANSNYIRGNYIGLAADGISLISGSSQNQGVLIQTTSANNIIGGSVTGEGNVISGNTHSGINHTTSEGTMVYQNIIGLQADGATYVTGNQQQYGIYVNQSTSNNFIEIGNSSDPDHKNTISGNEIAGVYITGSSNAVWVKANYIGTDVTGTSIVTGATQDYGIYAGGTGDHVFGGATASSGNLISGNTTTGIHIATSSNITIYGNIIGPDASGNNFLTGSSQITGIHITTMLHIIGGNVVGKRNIISGNSTYGIYITSSNNAYSNNIKGNYIGINKDGNAILAGSNQDYGVYLTNGTRTNIIGGNTAGDGNVISGNVVGVFSNSTHASGNSIFGNIIGPQADGNSYLASNIQTTGVELNGSLNNTIGGNTSFYRNIISGNEDYGIYLTGAACSTNVIKGNYIGCASSLAAIAGSSQDYGVYVGTSASNNTLGTINSGEGNTISYNTVNGLYLTSVGAVNNKISGNSIYQNTGKPINLNYGGSQANNGKSIPVISSATSLLISGTAQANDVIEVFTNTSGNCYDAATYVGTTTADGSGNWSLSASLNQGEYVLATSRDASNNTSEYTTCQINNTEYFWVNDAGNWSEFATHWAKTSGGGVFHTSVPDINSIVHFDTNSMSGAGIIVNMDVNGVCKSINFEDVNKTPVINGSGSLRTQP